MNFHVFTVLFSFNVFSFVGLGSPLLWPWSLTDNLAMYSSLLSIILALERIFVDL